MSERPAGPLADSAATRLALTAARALTSYDDTRIPEAFPPATPEAADRIAGLHAAVQDYCTRAHDEATVPAWQSRAQVTMSNTHAAGDLLRVLTAYVQAATGDMRPAEPVTETLLLGVLTWRLATGSAARSLEKTVVALAAHDAGFLLGSDSRDETGQDAPGRFATANENLEQHRSLREDPDTPLDFETRVKLTVGWLFSQLAQDAYSLGLTLLAHGDRHRARRWLAFAHLHGIYEAGPLVPSLTASGDAEDEQAEGRIDFGSEPQRWRVRADIANKTAVFHPADDDVSTTDPDADDARVLPCVEIAGVQCYFYLDGKTGQFKVSLHFDTAEPWLLVGDREMPLVPIRVQVGETVVFDA